MWVVSTLLSTPRWVASTVTYSCQPPMPTTLSPTAKLVFFDSMTSPTVPPIMTSSSACEAA